MHREREGLPVWSPGAAARAGKESVQEHECDCAHDCEQLSSRRGGGGGGRGKRCAQEPYPQLNLTLKARVSPCMILIKEEIYFAF